ncbi:hypothetical protein DYB39_04205 [Providencia rettgeri]|nr:hypothetical protein DYB39_03845 [Providencia rettgeri]RFT12335.1 hypothetical protein DYB39_04205 [Providencia rettgeri]
MNNSFEIEVIFKFSKWNGNTIKFPVQSYMRDGDNNFSNRPFKLQSKPTFEKYWLTCKCGANEWTDNSRDANEYECNQCGMFITVIQ